MNLPAENTLLGLPAEIRNMIWEQTAANAGWTAVMATNRQVNTELSGFVRVSSNIDRLQRVVFRVDPSYQRGVWLEVECHWTEHSGSRHHYVTFPCQDMDAPVISDLLGPNKKFQADCFEVRLVAPRRGYFWGAFLMMFAKMLEVVGFLGILFEEIAVEHKPRPRIFLTFLTEEHLSNSEDSQQTSFWECRCSRSFLDRLPEDLGSGGTQHRPYFYEYFLASLLGLDEVTSPEGVDFKVELPRDLRQEKSSLLRSHYRRIIDRLTRAFVEPPRIADWESRKHKAAGFLAQWLVGWRLKLTNVSTMGLVDDNVIGAVMRRVQDHCLDLERHLPYYLDHWQGPAGGCLDMVRLHRFKTTKDASPRNLFHVAPRYFLSHTLPGRNASMRHLERSIAISLWRCFSLRDRPAGLPVSQAWVEAYPRGIRWLVERAMPEESLILSNGPQRRRCRSRSMLEWQNRWTNEGLGPAFNLARSFWHCRLTGSACPPKTRSGGRKEGEKESGIAGKRSFLRIWILRGCWHMKNGAAVHVKFSFGHKVYSQV